MELPPSTATYNVLHNIPENEPGEESPEPYDPIEDDDYDDLDENLHKNQHSVKKMNFESFDFNDSESLMWRKVNTFK